jgi:broad specificity phosphatase PhoE
MPVSKRVRYFVVGLLAAVPLIFTSATAWAEEPIVIDFVRHGQDAANAAGIIETTPPGDELTPLGYTEAMTVGAMLAPQSPFAGLYDSDLFRTQETAACVPGCLADLTQMTPQILSGLNEINAGIYEGSPVYSLEGLLYLLTPAAWTLGADFVPIPGSTDPNGIAFDERFGDAVQTIYGNTVESGGSNPTDVAFSSEGAITTWTLMNVKNPDFGVLFDELLKTGQFLPNGGEVVVEGDPQDGWTLVSYDGQPVPQDPGLPTELFVDARNLIEAPQFAAYNIYDALMTGDPATVTSAIDGGLSQVISATEQFPVAVISDLTNALAGDLSSAVASSALAAF